MFCEFRKGGADVVEAQSAAAGHVHGGKIFLSDHIEIEMKHELTRIGVHVRQRFLRGCAAALELDIPGIDMPHRRAGQEVLLRRIQPFEPEERDVRLADKRRLAPEAHQFRRALADDVGHHHSIYAAGRSACRSIQIGVAIKPQQVHMLVVAPRTGQQTNHLRAIAAYHQHQRAGFDREFRAGLQVIQTRDNLRQIARAPMFLIVGEKARGAITIIRHLVPGALQPFDETRGAQRGRSLFGPWRKSRRARGCANQGNLLRLTDDFDRQGLAPCPVFPVYRAGSTTTGQRNAGPHTAPRPRTIFALPGPENCKFPSGAGPARWSLIPEAA